VGQTLQLAPAKPGAGFFCRRFQTRYNTLECAIRTDTHYAPCASCDQGRFNLQRHADDLTGDGVVAEASARLLSRLARRRAVMPGRQELPDGEPEPSAGSPA
jgi:hypothetical protein